MTRNAETTEQSNCTPIHIAVVTTLYFITALSFVAKYYPILCDRNHIQLPHDKGDAY